jgi:hypothetical protein
MVWQTLAVAALLMAFAIAWDEVPGRLVRKLRHDSVPADDGDSFADDPCGFEVDGNSQTVGFPREVESTDLVMLNGLTLIPGADYSIQGSKITFLSPLVRGDRVRMVPRIEEADREKEA